MFLSFFDFEIQKNRYFSVVSPRMLLHDDTMTRRHDCQLTMTRLPAHDDTIGALPARFTITIRLGNHMNTPKRVFRELPQFRGDGPFGAAWAA